jgi:hypothetical protein
VVYVDSLITRRHRMDCRIKSGNDEEMDVSLRGVDAPQ